MPDDKEAKDAKAKAALQAAKEKLLVKGKKEGKLDQRDIFAAIPDTPENVDLLDSLYTELGEENIELVAATEPSAEDFTDEWTFAEVADEFATQNAVTEYLMTWKDGFGNAYYTTHLTGNQSDHKDVAIRMADDLANALDAGEYE